jgi:hypothetical protein
MNWDFRDSYLRLEWWGTNRHLNPLASTRPVAFSSGAALVSAFLLALWVYVSGPRGMIPQWVMEFISLIAFLPGFLALSYAFLVPPLLDGLVWQLTLEGDVLTYRAQSYWHPIIRKMESWSVPFDKVARVETGATSDWQPTRPGLLWDKPVPRNEAQTFLFMDDGSRRVIATLHDGRESLSTLAQSMRSHFERRRSTAAARPLSTQESIRVAHAGEGFDL